MNKIFHKTVVTVFGLGMAPFAPGTFGALGAVLFLYILKWCAVPWTPGLALSLVIGSTLLGVWSSSKLIEEWGDDPSRVVIDEFAGLLTAMILIPLDHLNIWLGFALFRFFDILKPLGIRWIDRNVKGAWGIMLDDILAGLYGLICLGLLHYLNF